MAVQVWVGEKPEHPNERRAIMALANGLDRLDGLYLILANFSVGGNTIDLVIIKQDAVFIIELKHCDGKVFGGVNGPWFVESANGERKRLNPGRKNPYNQVIAYFYALTNFLNEHRRDFLSSHKATSVDFRTCKRAVVIGPTIQEGSKIELDWKVELRGLDELPAFLVTERSSEIDLTEEEMLKIPELLHCTRWNEINNLLVGVLPKLEETHDQQQERSTEVAFSGAAVSGEQATAPPTPVIAPEAGRTDGQAPISQRQSLRQRAIAALRTTTGRLALGISAVALILLAVLVLRPTQVVIPLPDQPPLANTTPSPGFGVLSTGAAPATECTWVGFQPIGKRWDTQSQGWVSVDMDGAAASQNPDVVVTLEQVVYCSDRISLTWSVRNNSKQAVELPLRSDNIRIRDRLGNEYTISDSDSQPGAVRAAPGEQARGTAIVRRPVSQNASSLLVWIKDKPFGEASWQVSLANGR